MRELYEGLRKLDLKFMVYPLFEVDTYCSKMGEDQDVCVLSFRVKDREPARDLMEFIEKSFHFVLDADISSGENNEGEYFVFVEIQRTNRVAEQIENLIYGINKLTDISEWKFKYHKQATEYIVDHSTLMETIPTSSILYNQYLFDVKVNETKSFFSKTLMDDFTLDDDVITIWKPYDQKIRLKLVAEDINVLENSNQPLAVDSNSMSEIFWLTKVLGDYNISKIGDNFVFENGSRTMILQRII